ncbi:MAG: hypothetical protein Q8O09_02850 [Bacillota bacterium]|nr:hypothetical protein [Bacillota bacterium]
MWMVLHVTEGEKTAELIQELLLREGFLVKVEPFVLDNTKASIMHIMVLSSEVEEARKVLIENGYV